MKKLNVEFSGKQIVYLKTDIAIKDEITEAFNRIKSKFGGIDILVNTGGIFNDKDVNATLLVNTVRFRNYLKILLIQIKSLKCKIIFISREA